MSHGIRKPLALLLCLIFCLTLVPPVWAEEIPAQEPAALGSEGEGEPVPEETAEPDGYARLLAAIQNKETNVNLDGMGTVTIHNDLTIPADMFVSAWGGSVIEVPEGVTLSVNGELHADGFILDGTLNVGEHTFVNMGGIQRLYNGHPLGTLNVGYGSSVDMREESYNGVISEYIDGNQLPSWVNNNIVEGGRVLVAYDAMDDEGFEWHYEQASSLPESFIGRVNVRYAATLDSNLDAFRNYAELYVDGAWGSEGALTIAQGTAVSVGYTCIQNATLTVNGQLINNDRIELRAQKDGEGDTISKLPRIVVENGGELIGPGMIYVYDVEDEETAKGCIQGLGELTGHQEDDHWVFYSSGSLFEALEAACNAHTTDHLSMRDLGELTIERSITIPDYLYLDAKGTILTVPDGVTLTMQGGVKTRAIDIQNGGKVIMDGGRLDLRETQIGDFKINGALVLNNTTVEIPAPIWGNLSDAEKGNITFSGDNALVRAMFEPNEDNIAKTFNRANLTVEQHVMPVIDVNIPITLPEDITVGQGVRLKVHQDITVPAGRKLTLNASSVSILDDSKLIVYGTLDSKSFLDFAHTENSANNPRLIIEDGGTFTGGCVLGVQDHNNPEAYFSGVDLSGYGRVMDNTGTRFMPSGIFYHDLKEACASANPPQNMKFINLGTITIEENLTIPAGMRVNAEGTKILVPDGVTLTVNGILSAGELEIKGAGSVVFDNAAFVVLSSEPSVIGSPIIRGTDSSLTVNHPHELTVMYPASDLESLHTAAQNANSHTTANVDNNVQVKSPITVPEGTDIPLTGANLMIEKGGKLTLNGTITANNAFIAVNDDGRLENNGSISMSFGEDFFMPKLIINGGEYAGGGSVIFYDEAKHIEGTNTDAFTVTQLTDPDRWVYSLNTDFAYQKILEMAAMSEDAWEDAGRPNVDIQDMGDVRINSNTAIPSHLFVNAKHDRIIVPQGVELIIDGGLRTKDLIIEAGGKVTVYGYLEVSNQITGDGELVINGTWVELKASGLDSLNREKISLVNNGGFQVVYYVDNDNEFIRAVNDILGRDWPRSMHPVLNAGYDVEAGGDLTIPDFVEVDITDEKTFTLSEDATLTVDGVLRAKKDAKIIINGTLVNNGTVDTNGRRNEEDRDPRLIFGNTAVYRGRGYLGVMDNNNPLSYISGLDVTGFATLEDNVGIRYYQVGDVWGELQAAINNGESYYYMGNLGELTMPSDFTLPENFSIETWGTTIIVPDGKTLTIAPNAHIGIHNLVVQEGGKVVVSDNGYLNTYTSLVLNGSMTAGDNAKLHLPATSNDVSFVNNITLNNSRSVTIHFYPADERELRNAITTSDTLPEPYHGNIHVRFPWTLSSSIAFDGKTDLEIETNGGYTGSLTIENGGELMLNRYTQVRSTDLTVKAGGKLINNAELVLEKNDRFEVGNLAVEEGGSYAGDGIIRVYGTSEAEAPDHITGIDNLISLRTEHDGEECTEFRPDAFLRLKQAVEDEEKICDLKGVGYVRISENFTIPAGMKVEAWDGTVIDVPEGVTLTINGEIFADGLILNGGIVLGEGVYSDLGNLYEIENQNGRPLGNITLARNAEAKVRQHDNNVGINPYLVDRWVNAGENARLGIDYYDTWIEDGIRRSVYDAQQLPDAAFGSVHLVNNQTLRDLDLVEPRYVCLEVSGHWDENGWQKNGLTLEGNTRTDFLRVNGGDLYIKDRFENVDHIELHTEQGVDPHLTFVNNPEIIGRLRIYVYGAESEQAARARVEGIDGLDCYQEGDAWVLTKDVFSKFKAACEDGKTTYFDLSNLGEFVIEESVVIPERMQVDAWGTIIDVPAEVELTVNRDFYPDGFLLNGTLNIGNDIFVDINTLYDISNGRPAGILRVGANASVDIQGVGYNGEDEVFLDTAQLSNWAHKEGNNGRILLRYDAWNDTDFADRYERADALERPYVGRVCVAYEMILEDNLNAREDDVELAVNKRWDGENGSLTIPAGKTLTVGCMNMAGGTLTVNGTFDNTDRIDLNKGDNNAMPGILVNEGGKYIGAGRIYVYDVDSEEAARACVEGIDDLECYKEWEDGPWVLYSNSSAFEALKAACADGSTEYISLTNLGRLVIEENLTIPARLYVDAWGTVIDVPAEVTLNVNSDFYPGGFLLNGTLNVGNETNVGMGTLYGVTDGRPAGTLNVGYHCHVDIEGMGYDAEDELVYLDSAKIPAWAHKNGERGRTLFSYDAWDDTDFAERYSIAANLPEPFMGRMRIKYPMTLSENINAYANNVELKVDAGYEGENGSITVAEGKTLTAQYMGLNGGTLTVNGMLVNTDRIELQDEGNAMAAITVGENGKLIGSGEIDVHTETLADAEQRLVGFTNLTEGEWSDDQDAWAFHTTDDPFELLALACEQQSDYLDLRRYDTVTIGSNITIPESLAVDAATIIVPEGVTLTVQGYLRVGGLKIAQTGKVIDDGGYLGIFDRNANDLVIDGSLELNNSWMEIQAYYYGQGLDATERSHITCQGNAGVNVVLIRNNSEIGGGVEGAIEQAMNMLEDQVPFPLQPIVNINYDFTMTDDLTISEGLVVIANNRFTVPVGKTLTVDGTLNIRQNGVVDVFGTLENNNFVEYKPASSSSTGVRLILEDGAVYTGPGFIGIRLPAVPEDCIGGLDLKKDFVRWDDDMGSRFRMRPVIDLMLPAMLTEIESEAFAGGAFSSVCIPASVTTIAADAFGDMQGLTIFGATDTARSFATSEYAQAHGYTFVEYDAAA